MEHRRTLVADRVRTTNRLTAALKLYFPQVLDWFEDKATIVFCEFLEKWPTLQSAKRARKATLERFVSADALCCYAGIAPVAERSGNKSWMHWRYSCPKFLRQSFIEWTNQTVRFSFWARAFYQTQREKGKTPQMAIRALAFKWIRILWRCWQDRKPYDEAKYLMVLKEKGSPLVKELAS